MISYTAKLDKETSTTSAWLGWTLQLNSKNMIVDGNVFQQWI